MKTLDVLSVRREGECIIIEADARTFLHNQVRSMVGALKAAGEVTVSADDVQAIVESRDTALRPTVAPPEGWRL